MKQSMATAWWTVRIYGDARNGKMQQLGEYHDELLTPTERLEKSALKLAAFFDARAPEPGNDQ